jgi:hypothetical protein
LSHWRPDARSAPHSGVGGATPSPRKLRVAAIYVLINLLVDIGYALLDPRIRHDQ